MWSHSQHLVAVGTSWRGRGAPRWKSWRCFRGTASWTSDSARSPPRCPAFCSQGSAFPDCMGVAVHGSGVMHMRGRGACDLHKSQILFPAKKKKKILIQVQGGDSVFLTCLYIRELFKASLTQDARQECGLSGPTPDQGNQNLRLSASSPTGPLAHFG